MIFLDVETQNSTMVGKTMIISELKISYVGVIDDSGKEYDFWEKDMNKLGELIRQHDWVVGYNLVGFDMPVIANYVGDWVKEVPVIDLMIAIYKKVGFRPKLDHVTNATLGYGKNGVGSDAPRLYAEGKLDELKKYCLQDVKITRDLYNFGLREGYINYFDKKGFLLKTDIDWNLGKVNAKSEETANNLSLF